LTRAPDPVDPVYVYVAGGKGGKGGGKGGGIYDPNRIPPMLDTSGNTRAPGPIYSGGKGGYGKGGGGYRYIKSAGGTLYRDPYPAYTDPVYVDPNRQPPNTDGTPATGDGSVSVDDPSATTTNAVYYYRSPKSRKIARSRIFWPDGTPVYATGGNSRRWSRSGQTVTGYGTGKSRYYIYDPTATGSIREDGTGGGTVATAGGVTGEGGVAGDGGVAGSVGATDSFGTSTRFTANPTPAPGLTRSPVPGGGGSDFLPMDNNNGETATDGTLAGGQGTVMFGPESLVVDNFKSSASNHSRWASSLFLSLVLPSIVALGLMTGAAARLRLW